MMIRDGKYKSQRPVLKSTLYRLTRVIQVVASGNYHYTYSPDKINAH